MTPARIAFVAPYAWSALSGEPGYVGGAEMQQARLARVLAARGHDVWMIVADFGQPARVTIDGVTAERAYAPFAGVPGLRFFHPRWSGIVSALDRVSPDVVYQRAAGALTGQCALWARARGRRFVFACAHDFDTLPRSPVLNVRERMLSRWGIRHADRVLAQSAYQAESLMKHHGVTAPVVRNLIPVPAEPRGFEGADRVVWLGTVKPEKRPEWMLAAARRLPGTGFTVAGGAPPPPAPDGLLRELGDAARTVPNLELTGAVAPPDVPGLLARAAIFAHTSPAEGFPNTLLEAWALGVPSISAVDPDGAVSTGGVGLKAESEAEFVRAVETLLADPARRRALGVCARAWVEARHAPARVAEDFEAAVGLTPERKR